VTGDPRPRASWRLSGLAAGVVLFAVIALAAALYLSDAIQRHLVVPSGADTPAHLWRAELVAATDLRALFDASAQDFQVNPDRVGLPVLASLLSGLGVTPWHLMFIVPALAAALLAAAGWGFARAAEEPRWAAPVYALALAGSVPFALTTKSYLDNALVDGLIVASAAGLLLIASDRAAVAVTAVLLGGGILMHWPVGTVFWAIALLFGLLLVPGARAARGASEPWWRSRPARVFGAAGAGLAVGGLPLLLTPGANLPDRGTGRFFKGNVDRLLPRYRVPAILATLGLAAAVARRTERRNVLLLLVAWLVPLAVAGIAFVLGASIPLMRFLGMTLAIPVLAALLVTSLVAWMSRRPRSRLRVVLVALTAVVAVVAVGATMVLARDLVRGAAPAITPAERAAIRPALAYAEDVDADALVVIVTREPGRVFRRVRMLAPPRLIPRIGVFQGTPEELFDRAASADGAAVPTGLTGPDLKNAMISADAVRLLRTDGAIAVALRPFLDDPGSFASGPGIVTVADGVFLAHRAGERPAAVDLVVPPLEAPAPSRLIRDAIVAFLALLVSGLGWSWGLVPAATDVRLSLAPAIGLALSLIVGALLGLQGVALGGVGGVATFASVAVSGVAFALWRRRRPARTTAGEPTEEAASSR
jgi:hypothetical protein